jgi:hypothetical protein
VIVLTAQELVELTKKVRPSAQARVLHALGIPSKPRPDGSLVVYRIHVETPTPAGARLPSPVPVLQP